MFIAFPESLKNIITDVSPGFWRLQALTIKLGNFTTLLINTYFPTDPQKPQADESELLEILGFIREVIRKNEFDALLWAGDINAHFLRNTSHTFTVNETIEDLGLTKSWDKFSVDFTCCHELLGVTHVSTLDDFFWSERLNSILTDAGVIHHPDNTSDHSPIYCVLDHPVDAQPKSSPVKKKPRPSWKKATNQQKDSYKNMLESRILQLVTPVSLTTCKDVKCRDPDHKKELDSFTMDLLETVQDVAELNLPIPNVNNNEQKKSTPGWKEAVKPYKEKAYFWHQIWKSCGRPINTEVHNIMKRTKNQYHYQFKKCQKAENTIKKSKLLDSCINGGDCDLFKEIKSIRKSNPVVATRLDGIYDNVKEHFMDIYEKLFNSTDDGMELMNVQNQVENKVDMFSLSDVAKVTPEIVKKAAEKLKSGKSDPVFSFSSDCFKNAKISLYQNLSIILQSCLVHGHLTTILLLATLVPIIKDKLGSINSSKNYRSIAISSILLKLIDWIFILLFGVRFGLNDFQFAYQAGCSTTMCTWAVLETVDLYLKNGSDVFSFAMDMAAAFDLTLHSLLFKKMIKAGFPAIFIRLFIYIYVNQMANVRWNGEISSAFKMTNGCRQGAVLSAIAYCFYCEDLFKLLKQRRTGCWILGNYHGIFGYSDDNWLLAPSLNALQDMLKTCEEYAAGHNLKFSTDPDPVRCKTKLMAFMKKPRDLPELMLCGNPLPWVDRVKHLGNFVSNVIDGGQVDIKVKAAKYVDKCNSLEQEFFFAHPETKVKLNKIYNSHFT